MAVLRELRQLHPRADIRFWSDTKFVTQARAIMGNFDSRIVVSKIIAGKLRRYNNLSITRQLMRPFTIVLPNLRDLLLVGIGTIQSIMKLLVWRPDVIFTKGGYVCLPVGFAARVLGIPIVVHDSDAHPGLTNRILARFASAIATGAPLEYYPYPADRSRYVGIPIAPEFKPFTPAQQTNAKGQFGFDPGRPLVVVTGGGLGAERINNAIASSLDTLLSFTSIALLSGVAQYDELRALTPQDDARFQLIPFVSKDMAILLGAADLIVTRAGATTLLELAALKKPIILIPNGYLTGGHQLKNAAVYADKHAALIVDDVRIEHEPELLSNAILRLLSNPQEAQAMAEALATFARPNAARDVAEMILSVAK